MLGIGTQELVLILVVVLLLFGGKKLPELSRSIGQAVNEFKKGMSSETHRKEDDTDKKS